ncbi:hypothetical protein IFM89_013047 [Coptis chinensis]|uniref:AtC3H46-like PABC-like domain-containing protein n=1 Tax=Coptis chinensis TaxID=261450 RepID=A0A835H0L5_9MAGN|nr:hypothetical protein IFM89_013047 [Coptis chinensis]
MIRLAFGPDISIQSLITQAKLELGLSPNLESQPQHPPPPASINPAPTFDLPLQFTPFSQASSHPFSSPTNLCVAPPYWDPWNIGQYGCYRTSRRSPNLPEFPVKACHYFNKGFCKHGIELELELTELLKSRRDCLVSIASVPLLYQEKYKRTLQAEGYLIESQRHGKAGYSLTKLLAQNSIRIIDRPHGQHEVVLVEDAPRYMEYINDRSDLGVVVAGSRQIYLTFQAKSTFLEEDVSNYFKKEMTVFY